MHSKITLGETIEEIAIFISRAVLLKDFPHFRLKKGHVYINSYHLKSKQQRWPSKQSMSRAEKPTYGSFSCPDVNRSRVTRPDINRSWVTGERVTTGL